MNTFTFELAAKRGFCSGVRRALQLVDATLQQEAKPVYLLHEIVHNHAIVADIAARGGVVVATPEEIPEGATVIFSAHGVAREVEALARARRLHIVDATCPLVKKIHAKAVRHAADALTVLIGHAGHPETVGTLGQAPGKIHLIRNLADVALLPERRHPGQAVWVLSQSTLSAEELTGPLAALKARYGVVEGLGDLCYATTERQEAVRELSRRCDLIVVIGSAISSNSNRLREVARQCGCRAILLENAEALRAEELDGARHVGVTAGASAPEYLTAAVVRKLESLGGTLINHQEESREER